MHNTERSPISSLVVKIVERCNLNCSYCYMYNHADRSYLDRPALMSERTFGQLLTRILEYCGRFPGHRMALAFHGGEPMMMKPERFERLAAAAEERLGECLAGLTMQTNATMVTDEWIEVLRRHRVAVGVSLDGPPEIHDRVRVDHGGGGSHDRVIGGLHRLREAGLFTRVLCVINPGQSGLDTYRHFRAMGITRMDFLIPDVSHDARPLRYGAYGRTPVADYLLPIFDEWYEEDDPDVSVRLFEDIITSILGGTPVIDNIGNALLNYLVIDTDGTIMSNDALKVCDTGVSESGLNLFDHGFTELHRGLPVFRRIVLEGMPLARRCELCPERGVCAGGYIPHRYSRANGFDNPSVWCEDLLALITHIRSYVTNEVAA